MELVTAESLSRAPSKGEEFWAGLEHHTQVLCSHRAADIGLLAFSLGFSQVALSACRSCLRSDSPMLHALHSDKRKQLLTVSESLYTAKFLLCQLKESPDTTHVVGVTVSVRKRFFQLFLFMVVIPLSCVALSFSSSFVSSFASDFFLVFFLLSSSFISIYLDVFRQANQPSPMLL